MILAAVDIINILRKSRLHVDGIGEIDIYAKSIIAGSNSVASRCQIDGIGGDFLFKCYYVADGKRLSQRDTFIEVYTIMGLTYRARCTIHRWMEGVTLDEAVINGVRDYRRLSQLFDRMALEQLRCGKPHGDISPENIILYKGGMRLIDVDDIVIPQLSHNDQDTGVTGNPRFIPQRGDILHPSLEDDNYAIALLSTLLAAISHYTEQSTEEISAQRMIPWQLIEGVILPNAESLEIAKQKLREVGDIAHYNIADALSKGCIDSTLIVQSLTAENRIAKVKREV
jgi:hypothetical protein